MLKPPIQCSFNPLDARGPSWGKATMEAYRVAIDDLTAKNMALQAKVEALTARLGGEPENTQNNAVASSSSAIPPASSGNTSDSDGESLCDLIDRHLVVCLTWFVGSIAADRYIPVGRQAFGASWRLVSFRQFRTLLPTRNLRTRSYSRTRASSQGKGTIAFRQSSGSSSR